MAVKADRRKDMHACKQGFGFAQVGPSGPSGSYRFIANAVVSIQGARQAGLGMPLSNH